MLATAGMQIDGTTPFFPQGMASGRVPKFGIASAPGTLPGKLRVA
jgi:hypothetical protein